MKQSQREVFCYNTAFKDVQVSIFYENVYSEILNIAVEMHG